MGSYIYCTKPSHIATAVVEDADGCQLTLEVALYRYAYKPSRGWDAERDNARMRVASGSLACLSAWKRAGRPLPILGTFFDADTMTVYAAGQRDANGCFDTRNQYEVVDDEKQTYCRVVRWVKLPKGVTEAAMPAPRAEGGF